MPLDESATISPHTRTARERRHGLLWGLLGVASFSLTLPATRVAVADLDPVFVGLGRAVVAATLAAIVLAATRTPWPGPARVAAARARRRWRDRRLSAVLGVGDALRARRRTAQWSSGSCRSRRRSRRAWLAHERPSRAFWWSAAFGSAVVVGFAFWQGGGTPQPADALLALAAIAAAIGYAEGGRLARTLGGWQVISWALVIAAPVRSRADAHRRRRATRRASAAAWAGFAYVSVVSMFLGFFAWYRGLALGGIAAVGQVQLLQPFLTIFASALLLGEAIDPATFVAAALVIAAIAMGRRAGCGRLAASLCVRGVDLRPAKRSATSGRLSFSVGVSSPLSMSHGSRIAIDAAHAHPARKRRQLIVRALQRALSRRFPASRRAGPGTAVLRRSASPARTPGRAAARARRPAAAAFRRSTSRGCPSRARGCRSCRRDFGQVAGVQPAVCVDRRARRFVVAPVAQHHARRRAPRARRRRAA